MEFYSNIFLLLMLQIFGHIQNTFSLFMKCPTYQLNFQKIVGYRPPLTYLTELNLMSNEIFNGNQNFNSNSLIPMPMNIMCWEICARDPECMSYVLIIDKNTCYGFSFFQKSNKYNYMPQDIDLVPDTNAIYIEKTCLKVPNRCKSKLWAITKIPGSTLIFQGKKTVPTLVTRRECAERCILETEFLCLSASFSPSYKNNYERLNQQTKMEDIVGQCILSNKDKMLQPDAFRAASKGEEYIENECHNRPIEDLQCSFELYSKSAFLYAEISYEGLTQRECQNQCLQENRFYCLGVTFVGNVTKGSKCFLHSEDLISMGPRSLKSQSSSLYMKRVRCLNISVVCNHDEMVIKYSPNDWFRGKLYTNSHSDECSVQGNGTEPTILRLPIGNEIKENRCGILRAYDVKSSTQRIFLSTLLILQHNLNVQTQGDRLIKVGCILNNISKDNEVPDDVALESTLAFTQTEFPNEGSIQTDASKNLPTVRMQIIDADRNYQTNDVHIGQNLELQIIVEPANTLYDIQARSLIARSDDSGAIVLIDKRGCPTDITVFPALEKISNKNEKLLKGKFHAFKFTGTSSVSFEVKIHFCLYKCAEPNCGNLQNINNDGMTRSKRSDGISITTNNTNSAEKVNIGVDIQTPIKTVHFTGPPNYIAIQNDSLTSVSRNDNVSANYLQNHEKSLKALEIPLKLNLNVRGPYYGETDTLICGENNKILVAGFDFRNPEEWCINYSLLIAILIFWFVLQVIFIACCCYFIKRYKRMIAVEDDRSTLHRSDGYIDYIDGRKVHWADQGTMSEFNASQM